MKAAWLMLTLCLGAMQAQAMPYPDLQRSGGIEQPVMALYEAGRYREALAASQQLVQSLEQTQGDRAPGLAGALVVLSRMYWTMADYPAARHAAERAERIARVGGAMQLGDLAGSLHAQALVANSQSDYANAERLFREALALRDALGRADDPALAELLGDLAGMLKRLARIPESRALFERAIAIGKRHYTQDHWALAELQNNFAMMLDSEELFDEAVPRYREALRLLDKTLGQAHPKFGDTLANLGWMVADSQARSVVLREFGGIEPLRALGAGLALGADMQSIAIAMLRRAVAIDEVTYGKDHPSVGISYDNLATLLDEAGRTDEAISLVERALVIFESRLGPDHPDTAICLDKLAGLYAQRGRVGQAIALSERALRIDERVYGAEHPQVSGPLFSLAMLHVQSRAFDKAEALLLRAQRIDETRYGHVHRELAPTLKLLAESRAMLGKFELAADDFRRLIALREKLDGPRYEDRAMDLFGLASCLYRQGHKAEAGEILEQIRTEHPGWSPPGR